MTSSTDQDEASVNEASLSCFTWSGPVVELAAVEKPNQVLLAQSNPLPSVNGVCGFIVSSTVKRQHSLTFLNITSQAH